jgi:hypothetical protein
VPFGALLAMHCGFFHQKRDQRLLLGLFDRNTVSGISRLSHFNGMSCLNSISLAWRMPSEVQGPDHPLPLFAGTCSRSKKAYFEAVEASFNHF